MAGLVRLDVQALLRRIGAECARQPRVAAAYLFGSALTEMRPDSDVAVVPHPSWQAAAGWEPFALPPRLADALGRWCGHRFEVTPLSLKDPIFAISALHHAVLVYDGEGDAHAAFPESVAQAYRLDGPRYWRAVG